MVPRQQNRRTKTDRLLEPASNWWQNEVNQKVAPRASRIKMRKITLALVACLSTQVALVLLQPPSCLLPMVLSRREIDSIHAKTGEIWRGDFCNRGGAGFSGMAWLWRKQD